MEQSPRLSLPFVQPAQAQKHVTVNESLRRLDVFVNTRVRDRDRAAPPSSPSEGDAYIAAANASGEWAGTDLDVWAFLDGAWERFPPFAGWNIWVDDENRFVSWNGSAWVDLMTGSFAEVPLVNLKRSGNVALGSQGQYNVTYDQTPIIRGNIDADNSAGTVTIRESGIYLISGQVGTSSGVTNSGDAWGLQIRKNASDLVSGGVGSFAPNGFGATGSEMTAGITLVRQLDTNDVINISIASIQSQATLGGALLDLVKLR